MGAGPAAGPSGAVGEGNANEKAHAFAIQTHADLHLPAHAQHRLPHDGQAQARAIGGMARAPVEAFEHPLVFGGRAAIERRFSVSRFWAEINRTGATITSTLGTMAYLLAHDTDRPEMPRSGAPEANTSLRLLGAAPLPVEVDSILKQRFGI